jgi:hypothetical protein
MDDLRPSHPEGIMSTPTTTEITFHDIKRLEAKTYDTVGAPLVLMIETSYGKAEIILYMDDFLLANMVQQGINDAMHAYQLQKPPAAETAAYAAASYAYNGSKR